MKKFILGLMLAMGSLSFGFEVVDIANFNTVNTKRISLVEEYGPAKSLWGQLDVNGIGLTNSQMTNDIIEIMDYNGNTDAGVLLKKEGIIEITSQDYNDHADPYDPTGKTIVSTHGIEFDGNFVSYYDLKEATENKIENSLTFEDEEYGDVAFFNSSGVKATASENEENLRTTVNPWRVTVENTTATARTDVRSSGIKTTGTVIIVDNGVEVNVLDYIKELENRIEILEAK